MERRNSGNRKLKKEEQMMDGNALAGVTNDTGFDLSIWNGTDDVGIVRDGSWNNESSSWNTTSRASLHCDVWEVAQHNLFQTANMFMAAAFVVPKNFKQNILLVR